MPSEISFKTTFIINFKHIKEVDNKMYCVMCIMFGTVNKNYVKRHDSNSYLGQQSLSCYLSSETYGRNGVTPIFRSFHRTASSTTGGWSSWNIFNVLLYILLSTKVSFLEDTILFLQISSFFIVVYITIFCKYTFHVCYVFNVNVTDSFDDRRSQCRLI